MSMFVQTLGLVRKGDMLSLAEGVDVVGGYLVDEANGARHRVKPLARPVLRTLRKPIELSQWQKQSGWLSAEQQAELIKFLDSIGGLMVKRNLRVTLGVWLLRLLYRAKSIRLQVGVRRFRPRVTGVLWAVSWGMVPLFVLVAVVTAGAYGLGLPQSTYIEYFVIGHLVFLAAVWLSMVVHELVHFWLANPHSSNSQCVVRGLRIGLLHKPLPERTELTSAVAGPLAGVVVCWLIAWLVWMLTLPALYWLTLVIVGLFHVVSWWPSYGDGQTLLRAIRVLRMAHA